MKIFSLFLFSFSWIKHRVKLDCLEICVRKEKKKVVDWRFQRCPYYKNPTPLAQMGHVCRLFKATLQNLIWFQSGKCIFYIPIYYFYFCHMWEVSQKVKMSCFNWFIPKPWDRMPLKKWKIILGWRLSFTFCLVLKLR